MLDPYGDPAEQIAGSCPETALIWNLADPDCPYDCNPLTQMSAKSRQLIASGLIDTLKKQWADARRTKQPL
ncbi:hypothetical protein [Marimonas arenosa]|uniref:Uncharacterized protein n=1 Tax=Marimonas arenosa TaxID=1795305 RepID=A0AAE3WAJ8_9RHOB|nr:hypothetical protein [Marimonas arenosa]MDQ2089641.1 hypothetical protein [Marimonas arenosa]